MTAPVTTTKTRSEKSKRINIIMKDGTALDGSIFIAEDMSLIAFLGNRKGGYMNMVEARRPKLNEAPGHLIVQTELAVLVTAPDKDLQIVGPAAAGAGEREIEIVLLGGKSLKGVLFMAPMQRMSDYVHHQGKFVGVSRASFSDGPEIGDVAVATASIAMIREARPEGPSASVPNIE